VLLDLLAGLREFLGLFLHRQPFPFHPEHLAFQILKLRCQRASLDFEFGCLCLDIGGLIGELPTESLEVVAQLPQLAVAPVELGRSSVKLGLRSQDALAIGGEFGNLPVKLRRTPVAFGPHLGQAMLLGLKMPPPLVRLRLPIVECLLTCGQQMSARGHLGQLRVELIQLPSKIQSLLLRLLLGLFAGFTKLVQFRVQLGLSLDELLPLGGESGSLLLDPLGSTRDRGLLGGQARPLVLKLLRLGGEPIALRAKLNLFLLELFDSLTKLHSGRFHRGMILLKLCLSGMQTFPLALQFASLGGKFISFGLKVVGLFSEAVLLRLDPRKVFGQRFAIVLDLFVKGLDLPTFGLQFGLLLKVELGQTVDLLTAVSAFDGFTEALNLGASLEQLLVGLRDFPTLGLKLGFSSIDFELLRIERRLSRGE